MRKLKLLFFFLTMPFIFISCFEDNDDVPVSILDLNDFVWKGMNIFYLYKNEIPDLANNRFSNNNEYGNYLNSFSAPENLFESLIYERQTIDKFSIIVPNYFLLEQYFQGTSTTNGMEFDLYYTPNNQPEVYGVVRYVLPNSPAANANLKRGDIFYGTNNQRLTDSNYIDLLYNQETYTLNLGFYNDYESPEITDDTIDPINQDISLNKIIYTENPIFLSKTINTNGINIGYLMYNGFIGGSENELNTVFGAFKSNNIQYLILDLRYNPGGSITTATNLASMITGQFTGSIFAKLIFNDNLQFENKNYTFESKLENGNTINHINLNKIYVLTTLGSASASEAVINGLKPYIDVIQIGSNTTGKTQASITIYDSPDFTRQGVNPIHTYAMQPLVANAVNKNSEAVPGNGLTPSIEYKENPLNYGVLGDENEPMLALSLADINGVVAKLSEIKSEYKNTTIPLEKNYESHPLEGGLIID